MFGVIIHVSVLYPFCVNGRAIQFKIFDETNHNSLVPSNPDGFDAKKCILERS